ncbi:MAG: hypothetical protein ACREMD_03220 [Gemmatimonadota bacterium]
MIGKIQELSTRPELIRPFLAREIKRRTAARRDLAHRGASRDRESARLPEPAEDLLGVVAGQPLDHGQLARGHRPLPGVARQVEAADQPVFGLRVIGQVSGIVLEKRLALLAGRALGVGLAARHDLLESREVGLELGPASGASSRALRSGLTPMSPLA